MGKPIYLVEMVAKVWPKFMRSGTPDAAGSWYNGVRIGLDPLKTYRVTAVARKGAGSNGTFYAGVALWDSAGANIPGSGNQWLYVANGVTPGTGWTTYTGTFGAGTGNPFPAAAVAMAPLTILNYASTAGPAANHMDVMDLFIEDTAAPGVAISLDRYFRDERRWIKYEGSLATFLTLTSGGDALAQTLTLRYATAGYQTLPSDTPANTFYEGRLLQPGKLRQELPPDFTGAIGASYGELALANGDGALGDLPFYGLDGQALVIKRGQDDAAYSTFTTVMQATMEQALADRQRVRVRLRGPDARLDRPLLSARYLGNNALPAGLEGNSELQGQIKPRLYGAVEGVSPPCVNSSRYIYQVSNSVILATATNVFVAGVELTGGALYTSQADMETNAPAAGAFRAWREGGMFRLGTAPNGVVTCNASVVSSGQGNPWELWNVLYQIAYDAGVQPSEFYQAQSALWPKPDFWGGTWDSPVDYPHVGLWVNDLRTAKEALEELALSLGVWFGFTRNSSTDLGTALVFKAEPFPPPYNTITGFYTDKVWYFDESHIIGMQAMAPPGDGSGVPTYRVDLGFRRNYTVLSPSDAPSLPAAALGFAGIERLNVLAEDSNVITKHSTAQTLSRNTCINNDRTAAGYEAQRQLTLRNQVLPWYELRVTIDTMVSSRRQPKPRLGNYVYVKWPELRAVGKDGVTRAEATFTVHALEWDWARNECRMTVRQALEP